MESLGYNELINSMFFISRLITLFIEHAAVCSLLIILQRIILLQQPLIDIHPDAFQGLLGLKALQIQHCELREIPPLHDLRDVLEILNLEGNNITDSTFNFSGDFPKLKLLSMSYNFLISVPSLTSLTKQLYTLHLSHNKIESVRNIYDVTFFQLRVLKLEFNRIKYISLSRLRLPNLVMLSINNNDLVTIEPIGVLLNGVSTMCRQLEVLLRGNPWHCNDSFTWIYNGAACIQGAHQSNLIYTSPSCQVYSPECGLLLCQTPIELRGRQIVTLG